VTRHEILRTGRTLYHGMLLGAGRMLHVNIYDGFVASNKICALSLKVQQVYVAVNARRRIEESLTTHLPAPGP
jgi:hypothetical protein